VKAAGACPLKAPTDDAKRAAAKIFLNILTKALDRRKGGNKMSVKRAKYFVIKMLALPFMQEQFQRSGDTLHADGLQLHSRYSHLV